MAALAVYTPDPRLAGVALVADYADWLDRRAVHLLGLAADVRLPEAQRSYYRGAAEAFREIARVLRELLND